MKRSNIFSTKTSWEKDTGEFSTGEFFSGEFSSGEFTVKEFDEAEFSTGESDEGGNFRRRVLRAPLLMEIHSVAHFFFNNNRINLDIAILKIIKKGTYSDFTAL